MCQICNEILKILKEGGLPKKEDCPFLPARIGSRKKLKEKTKK